MRTRRRLLEFLLVAVGAVTLAMDNLVWILVLLLALFALGWVYTRMEPPAPGPRR